jgi:clan AA aspartic protease (TIGR02281 family)
LEGGTYVVPVLINGKLTLNFTLDSGAADVSIPVDVFGTLRRTGTISYADLLEPREYMQADGSVSSAPTFLIRTLKVGNVEVHNVVASVSPMQGNLLLGQSFLSRVRTWRVDNEQHVLVLNEDIVPHSPPVERPVTGRPVQPRIARTPTPPPPSEADDTKGRYKAAQAWCRAQEGNTELQRPWWLPRNCVALTDTDLARFAAVAGTNSQRYTDAVARCIGKWGNSRHCDLLTAQDVIQSEAEARAAGGAVAASKKTYSATPLRYCLSDNGDLWMEASCLHSTYRSHPSSAAAMEPIEQRVQDLVEAVRSGRISETEARRHVWAAIAELDGRQSAPK